MGLVLGRHVARSLGSVSNTSSGVENWFYKREQGEHPSHLAPQQESNPPNPNTNSLNADPNSTILFAQNLAHAQREVQRLQTLVRQALDGVQNAYHVGYSPKATAAFDICLLSELDKYLELPLRVEIMVELKSALTTLVDTLRQSGVGALPLIAQSTPPPSAQTPTATMLTPTATASGTTTASTMAATAKPILPPSEPELLQIATKQVQVLYEQLKAKQENAGVVANLLGVVGGDSSQGR
ncbi:hypothetical protein BKA70DRAFT_1230540 [Coprinopsis sp. MPI-PUGE-AT-0042]|nr:hypothetical protein BKA70DRAFT_1230540 [Coprinopsis sp. MPI-PUGE-AT-0042]